MSCSCPKSAEDKPPEGDERILEHLVTFLSNFAVADQSAPFEVVASRNIAIVAAFQAVERIARRMAR